jgi:vacuolar-type H+-ATPase subunit E/Vma4
MEILPWLTLLSPIALAIAGWSMKSRSDMATDLALFKVHVAENYARRTSLEAVERRILDAIENLGQRLDRIAESRQ